MTRQELQEIIDRQRIRDETIPLDRIVRRCVEDVGLLLKEIDAKNGYIAVLQHEITRLGGDWTALG